MLGGGFARHVRRVRAGACQDYKENDTFERRRCMWHGVRTGKDAIPCQVMLPTCPASAGTAAAGVPPPSASSAHPPSATEQ